MTSSSTLFRVFDVAFFVPGILLTVGLWCLGFLPFADPLFEGSAAYVVAGLSSLAAVYAVGLAVHGTFRFVKGIYYWIVSRVRHQSKIKWKYVSWFTRCDRELRENLAVYFWYTGAACWNLSVVAVVLFVCSMLRLWFMPQEETACSACVIAWGTPLAAWLFYWLGVDFEKAREKASSAAIESSESRSAD
jgi:hypothetical protein